MKNKITYTTNFNKDFFSKSEVENMSSLEKIINRIAYERMSDQSRWIDEQIFNRTTKFQRFLMRRFKLFRNVFNWEIRRYTYDSILKDTVEIYHHNKLVASKSFK